MSNLSTNSNNCNPGGCGTSDLDLSPRETNQLVQNEQQPASNNQNLQQQNNNENQQNNNNNNTVEQYSNDNMRRLGTTTNKDKADRAKKLYRDKKIKSGVKETNMSDLLAIATTARSDQ